MNWFLCLTCVVCHTCVKSLISFIIYSEWMNSRSLFTRCDSDFVNDNDKGISTIESMSQSHVGIRVLRPKLFLVLTFLRVIHTLRNRKFPLMFFVLSLMFFAFAWCERALVDIHAAHSKMKSMSLLLCDNPISSNVAYYTLCWNCQRRTMWMDL